MKFVRNMMLQSLIMIQITLIKHASSFLRLCSRYNTKITGLAGVFYCWCMVFIIIFQLVT